MASNRHQSLNLFITLVLGIAAIATTLVTLPPGQRFLCRFNQFFCPSSTLDIELRTLKVDLDAWCDCRKDKNCYAPIITSAAGMINKTLNKEYAICAQIADFSIPGAEYKNPGYLNAAANYITGDSFLLDLDVRYPRIDERTPLEIRVQCNYRKSAEHSWVVFPCNLLKPEISYTQDKHFVPSVPGLPKPDEPIPTEWALKSDGNNTAQINVTLIPRKSVSYNRYTLLFKNGWSVVRRGPKGDYKLVAEFGGRDSSFNEGRATANFHID